MPVAVRNEGAVWRLFRTGTVWPTLAHFLDTNFPRFHTTPLGSERTEKQRKGTSHGTE